MYGNHPYGTVHKRQIHRGASMASGWRTTDGKSYPVKIVRKGRGK